MGFWDNVVEELEYLGMTQKSLAEKAGFDASNVAREIRYKSSPSADTAVKIANVLNVSVEYLVTGEKKNSKTSGISSENTLLRLKNSNPFPKNLVLQFSNL